MCLLQAMGFRPLQSPGLQQLIFFRAKGMRTSFNYWLKVFKVAWECLHAFNGRSSAPVGLGEGWLLHVVFAAGSSLCHPRQSLAAAHRSCVKVAEAEVGCHVWKTEKWSAPLIHLTSQAGIDPWVVFWKQTWWETNTQWKDHLAR